MTTYRTGNHWGVTIVREATAIASGASDYVCDGCGGQAEVWIDDRPLCRREPEVRADSQLVAVVVNGDQALAERICALLNGDEQRHPHPPYPPFCSCGLCGPAHTPDVDEPNAPAVIPVREGWGRTQLHPTCVDIGADDEPPGSAWVCVSACRTAADGDAPPHPSSAPLSASEASGVPEVAPGAPRPAESECGCRRARLTDAQERADVRRRIAEQAEHRPSSLGDGLGYGPCVGCGQLWPCTASREAVS